MSDVGIERMKDFDCSWNPEQQSTRQLTCVAACDRMEADNVTYKILNRCCLVQQNCSVCVMECLIVSCSREIMYTRPCRLLA